MVARQMGLIDEPDKPCLTHLEVQSNLALRTFSVRAILVLKVKQVLILTVLKAKFDCIYIVGFIIIFLTFKTYDLHYLCSNQTDVLIFTYRIRVIATLGFYFSKWVFG